MSSFVASMVGGVLQEAVAELIGDAVGGTRGRRSAVSRRQADKVVSRLVGRVEDWRRVEWPGLGQADWAAAAAAVRDALTAAAPLDAELVVAADADGDRLADRVRSRVGPPALPAAATAVYERLLGAACVELVRAVRERPGFGPAAQAAVLREVRDVRRSVAVLVSEEDGADRSFTARYLDHVVGSLATFEVFGLARGGRAPARHPYATAYVPMAVARADRDGDADTELTGAGSGVEGAFADVPRVLLRGNAGAGKTTLLGWLTVQIARGRLPTSNGGPVVPLPLALRRFPDGDLPAPEELPALAAKVIDAERPAGWVTRALRSGQACVLVDGVDELPADRRDRVGRWLAELVRAYPQARYVVTTRPTAVEAGWLADEGFATFDLLPMSATGARDYLRRWHSAARLEAGTDDVARRWLDRCEAGLAEVLATQPEVRRLSASPLLCGLLCALYQDGGMTLPRDRKGLYDAALDLLLVRWDEQRHLRPVTGVALSREEQTVLLQRFAYSLIKNEDVQVSRETAVHRLSHAMAGLRSADARPDSVLQLLLERTGLLREPQPGVVQFVHRTFRDYLAGKEVVDSGDLRLLIENAHRDSWHDVVVMAVAHARPAERDTLLRQLLAGNAEAKRSPRVADRLHLVAAACLEQADVTATAEVRTLVSAAAARLIPPSTLDDAELLAKAGRFVLDLLPDAAGLTDAQAACVVRTAAMIGGDGAREKIATFTTIDDGVVIDEMLRAWRQAEDPADYARTVLAGVAFGDRRVDVRGWHRVQHLRHLTRLHYVRCLGDLHPLDPLAAIPNLTRLELEQNEVLRDLSPLTAARSLRELRLVHCSMLHDLGPLRRTRVERLALYFLPADLGTLAGAPIRALAVRDRRLAGGLTALPADLPLRELTVDNPADARSLAGIGRWAGLAALTVTGGLGPAELAEVATLPALTRLVVRRPSAPALPALAALTSLRELDLDDVPATEREAVRRSAPVRPGLRIRLNGATHPDRPFDIGAAEPS